MTDGPYTGMPAPAGPGQNRRCRTPLVYASAWHEFNVWALANGRQSLPAKPQTVALHLGRLAADGRAMATIEQARAAISHAHAAEGMTKGDKPARHPVVAETVKGWRNQAPAPKQASALTAEALARIRETAQFVKGTPLQELDHRRGVAILEREHTSPRPSERILEVETIKVPKPSSWKPESRSALHESVLAKGKKGYRDAGRCVFRACPVLDTGLSMTTRTTGVSG